MTCLPSTTGEIVNKPRIAWFATNKPGTMSSYVSALYLPLLEKKFELSHFVGDAESGGIPFGTAYEIDRTRPFDSFIYCLERDPASDFAWATLGVHPGIALLLEDFAPPEKPWLFQSSYDELSLLLASTANMNQNSPTSLSLTDKEPYPVDAEIRAAMLATTMVVASEEMLERIPQKFHSKCAVIPMPVKSSSLTRQTKKSGDPLTVAVCSPTTEDYLVSKIFLALKNYGAAVELHWLVGDDSDVTTLLRKQAEFATESTVNLVTKQRSFLDWQKLITTADVALHLQGWGRASLEPYLGMSLLSGMPTVVCNFGSGRLLPEDLAIKIPVGLSAARTLTEVLKSLSLTILGKDEIQLTWDYTKQAGIAAARYQLEQNVGELVNVIEKDIASDAAQIARLQRVRNSYRKAWIEDAEKDIGEFELGDSFPEAKQFLKGLIHE